MAISIPTSSRRSAQPSRPPPPSVYTMMAAAQMHSEGRLVQPHDEEQPPTGPNYDNPTNDSSMLLLRYKRIMEGQQAP
jgi:hypothetical protein